MASGFRPPFIGGAPTLITRTRDNRLGRAPGTFGADGVGQVAADMWVQVFIERA